MTVFFEKLYTINDPTGAVPKELLAYLNENFKVLEMTLQGQLSGENFTDTIYGKTIRSGTNSSTTYMALLDDGTFQAVRAGHVILKIDSASAGGTISFYTDEGVAFGNLKFISDTNASFAMEAKNGSVSVRSPFMVYLMPGSSSFTQNVGKFQVTGDLQVLGTKSCVVWTDEFDWVTLYANESLDNRFTDHGIGELFYGDCRVDLDPVFLACVHPDDWHIQLTPYGDGGLFVSDMDATGFTVKQTGGGSGSFKFAWTVTAFRKGYCNVSSRISPP